MLATDLELQLVRPEARAAIRRALESVADRAAARRVAVELDIAETAGGVDWAAIATEADAVASALEASLPEAQDWAEVTALLDTATMIRVRAGEAARRGGPFAWRKSRNLWLANGPTGTGWAVVPERGRLGIIVANWDRPDWVCASVEDAKRIAEEIDARPSFPRRLGIEEHLPVD